jgi:hypothetical protein
MRDASALGGQSGGVPKAAISSCSAVYGKPPPGMSHEYDETLPPGRTTRAISATPFAGSGTKKITSAITAASNAASGQGRAAASPTSNRAGRPGSRVRAKSSWGPDGSMPSTDEGAQRSNSSSVKAPLPQPTSAQRHRAGGASQLRKSSPARRLQVPMNSS